MTFDELMREGKIYLSSVLKGVCRDPANVRVAAWVVAGQVRLGAKVSAIDLPDLQNGNLGMGMLVLITTFGERRQDPAGNAFVCDFTLDDAPLGTVHEQI